MRHLQHTGKFRSERRVAMIQEKSVARQMTCTSILLDTLPAYN